jgi:hypothetical protein
MFRKLPHVSEEIVSSAFGVRYVSARMCSWLKIKNPKFGQLWSIRKG